ncbi:D-alanyl-D-alanine carboxypeptidase [hydrothermal vent metagenome]|uniref:D-alanyl-D-alanine carboxypeptidase n=1 Tax=hydrothermal vent metagenome TaxID=652676 RepID=A0A3B0ZNK4_9ZZZZ
MLTIIKRFILPLLLLVSFSAIAAVPEGLNSILQKFKSSLNGLSIYVSRVDQRTPWITYKSDVSRNPASIMKLLTSAAALDTLGPAYTWKTEFYVNQLPKKGYLNGPIYIKGYGDPYITVERLWAMIQELRHAGIKHIHGGIVLDSQYFKRRRNSTQSFDGQGSRSYNVQPYALLVNFQSLRLRFTPDTENQSVEVQSYPKVSTIKIDNKIRLTNKRCGIWKHKIKIRSVVRANQETLILSGRYSKKCKTKTMYRATQNPANYTAGLFMSLWRQQGGTIKNSIKSRRLPRNLKLIHSAPSLTLADIIRRINKYSNNIMTRHLLLTLIAELNAVPASETKGEQIIRRWLKKQKISTNGFRLENGAGLSRKTRVSAAQLGQALKVAYQKAYMPELMSSLPISGVDGTMARRRLTKTSHGQMHLKTGLLANVRSVAGYYLNPKGHRYVVVIMHNHSMAHSRRGKRLHNYILDWIFLNSH